MGIVERPTSYCFLVWDQIFVKYDPGITGPIELPVRVLCASVFIGHLLEEPEINSFHEAFRRWFILCFTSRTSVMMFHTKREEGNGIE